MTESVRWSSLGARAAELSRVRAAAALSLSLILSLGTVGPDGPLTPPCDPAPGLCLQIRVVNAFRQGLDARCTDCSSVSLAEVLRKQASLSKRLSQTSSIEYADNLPDELAVPEIDVERLSSHSHTETAV